MARNAQQEMIWQGRLHIGDDPGIYGDASYCGLAAELPITVYRSDASNTTTTSFLLIIETKDVETYAGYPGHELVVILYEPDPHQQFHSVERILTEAKLIGSDNNRKEILVDIGTISGPFRLSVRIRCDTTVNPGFYDDFVWRRLSLLATDFSFYGSLGFPS